MRIIIYIALTLFICCEKETPTNPNNNITDLILGQIDIGSDYCYQKYYNLENNSIVSENLTNDWDLAFFSSSNSIMLNSSKYMRIKPLQELLFSPGKILNIDDLIKNNNWHYDDPSGDITLLAFNHEKQTLSNGNFLVDRGYDCNNNHLGYIIINIIDYNKEKYIIQIINISNNGLLIFNDIQEIEKINNQKIYFSLNNNEIVEIFNSEWDLCFSQYTEFNVPHPSSSDLTIDTYLVTGLLQNKHIEVAVDTKNSFDNIWQENIGNYIFNTAANTIGYDWKTFDIINDYYSVNSNITYIIKNNLEYYKFRITGYYNNLGEKGCLNFEMQKL